MALSSLVLELKRVLVCGRGGAECDADASGSNDVMNCESNDQP
jgi:phosphoheptose isomerase